MSAAGTGPLSGKNALVTGGTSGLGLAIARGLVAAGARVIVASRSADKVASAASELGCEGVRLDVESAASISAAFAEVDAILSSPRPDDGSRGRRVEGEDGVGRLHILVNAAGVLHRDKAEDEPLAAWERVMRTNVTGTFLCAQEAGRRMIKAATAAASAAAASTGAAAAPVEGIGCILNIASLTSFVALSDVTSYACSKAAVMQLTKQLANDWARHGIRVNAIAPGVFPTEINRAAITGSPRGAWMLTQTPMGRFGKPDELAGLAVYLCSPAASFTTGAVIPCDGGFLARGVGPT